jgi:hypothetical protein
MTAHTQRPTLFGYSKFKKQTPSLKIPFSGNTGKPSALLPTFACGHVALKSTSPQVFFLLRRNAKLDFQNF